MSSLKAPEVREMPSGLILSEEKKTLSLFLNGIEWTTSKTANVGGERMNLIRIHPLPSDNAK